MKNLLFIVTLLVSLANVVDAKSLEFIDKVEISGTIESTMAVTTASSEVQKAEFILTPTITAELSDSVRLTLIGRIRGDLQDKLDPYQAQQLNRSSLSKRHFIGDSGDAELREAYIDTEIGNTFLRIGKQQVVWGQADGLKVLDVLNPQSFREFILDDFEDSRIPLWTVNAEIPVGESMLQLLWIPDQTYDDLPAAATAFAFTSPALVPQIPVDTTVTFLPLERPDNFVADSDVAAKLSAFVGGWDLSLNYAYHYVDRPVTRREFSDTGVTISQNYQRSHLIGGTFSNVFGDFTVRGEVGYSSDRYFLTDNKSDTDGVIRSDEFAYVLGLDYQGWRDWFVSAQLFQSLIIDPVAELVRDEVDTTGTLLLRRDFMNEVWQAELLLIRSMNNHDGLVQAALKYEWRSNIRLEFGVDMFFGDSQHLFGQFDDQDRISLGIEIGF